MYARHQFELRLAIERALNRKVPDNFINCYSDFVNWRELLPYMRYNQRVMHTLAEMTTELWNSPKKVNRFQLLRCMSRYSKVGTAIDYYAPVQKPLQDLLPETEELVFSLCMKIMTAIRLPVSVAQTQDVRSLANKLLMRVRLDDNRVGELKEALPKEPKLVNRLLRYNKAQSKISVWARGQINNPEWAYRRGEIIAWVIDEDPDFELTDEILRAFLMRFVVGFEVEICT